MTDDSFLLVVHADHRPTRFVLPGPPWAAAYEAVLDTAEEGDGLGAGGGTAAAPARKAARSSRAGSGWRWRPGRYGCTG